MNHAPAATNTWQAFIDWVDTHRSFKHYDHTDLAKEFDPKANVRFEQKQFDSDPFYGSLTFIDFHDGSHLVINYKGEVEFSIDPEPTPRSSSPSSHLSVHNHTGDQS